MNTATTGSHARPRVLLVSRKWPPAIGGMETYAVELEASLATRFTVDRWLLPGRKDGRPPSMLAYAGFVAKCMLRSLFEGRRHARVVYVDPVLFPVALVHALVAPSARRIVVMHGLDVIYGQRRGLLPAMYRLYFGTLVRCQRVFSQVVTVSSSTAALARAAGLRAVTVVNPSLPDSALTRAQGTRDVSSMRAGFARTVLCFGRLVPRKGALWFAQHVLPLLPEDVGLIVAGPSTHADQPALLASLPRVRYVGAVDPETLASLVRDADVVAMPNIATPESLDVEGFGLVAIEASSLGGRLLASRLQGLKDAVADGVTGTLVEPGDAQAWADAVLASFAAQREEPADHRDAVASATRRIYSRTVQAGAFAKLLLPPARGMRPQRMDHANEERSRLPHVVLDAPSRVLKAEKIVALLGPERFARARRVLEIGCGSGVIASTLKRIGAPDLQVHAVDVVDSRLTHDGFEFRLVEGTTLPYEDDTFDVVITNHVIEHVGDVDAQLHHLAEIRRVLRKDGRVYLAVPNTYRLVEPHFRLPFLSWLPRPLADRYVRLTGKGTHYDCVPLAHGEAFALFDRGGFDTRDVTIDGLRTTLALEFPRNRIATFLRTRVPNAAIALGMPIMPTFIFLLDPKP